MTPWNRLPLALVGLLGCATAGASQPTDPCKPGYLEIRSGYPDQEREARCAEQQRAEAVQAREAAKTPFDRALEDCHSGKDLACAEHLRDTEVRNFMFNNPAVDLNAVLESACRGKNAEACQDIKATEETNDRVRSYDPVASKRMEAALSELEELEKQWVNQLTTLSQLKCATGEQAAIADDWAKGAEARAKKLAELDAVNDEVGADAVWGAVWAPAREQFDLVIDAAERAALKCKLGA